MYAFIADKQTQLQTKVFISILDIDIMYKQ